MTLNPWPHHDESSAWVSASPERVFALVDEGHGQRVGSHIRVSGRVLGIDLSLDELVTEREPPTLKIWETVGSPNF